MSQEFKHTLIDAVDRSRVDLSHQSIGTLDFGRLQPILCKEILPGDDISLNINSFTRAASLAVPVMGKLRQDIHVFFVPNRVICEDFNKYITGLSETKPAYTQFTHVNFESAFGEPSLESNDVSKYDRRAIAAGLGFPVDMDYMRPGNVRPTFSVLPFRAYQRIWFDWYRDPQLISDNAESSYILRSSGLVNASDFITKDCVARYRSFKKDFFTTLLTSPNGSLNQQTSQAGATFGVTGSGTGFPNVPNELQTGNSATSFPTGYVPVQFLRAANALQRWMEKNNVVGHKVLDRLRARFGVAPTDVRLDRAEFLGGTSRYFNVGDVVSTSQSDGVNVTSPFGTTSHYASSGTMQGQMSGKAVAFDDSNETINYHSQEHGFLIAIMSIMPDTSYYGGLDRMWIRGVATPNSDRFDYFTPELANIGYQPVFAKELFTPIDPNGVYDPDSIEYERMQALQGSFDDNLVTGYQPRYNEYRFANDIIFGDMCRPSLFTENKCYNLTRYLLDEWLQVLESGASWDGYFTSLPFRTCDPLLRRIFDRIFAVPNPMFDHFNVENRINLQLTRSMPAYALPDLGDGASHDKTNAVPNAGSRL